MTDERFAWISEDHQLADRLATCWPDWESENGLEATLDVQPEWSGWTEWDAETKRHQLSLLLDQWYPAEADVAGESAEDTSQPRWDEAAKQWQYYDHDRGQWADYPAESAEDPTHPTEDPAHAEEFDPASVVTDVAIPLLALALDEVPEAAELSEDELREILLKVIAEETAAAAS